MELKYMFIKITLMCEKQEMGSYMSPVDDSVNFFNEASEGNRAT